MPLIKLTPQGATLSESFEYELLPDEEPIPSQGEVIVSLTRYLANADNLGEHVVVRLTPEDDAALLEPHLGRLGRVEVSFPKYVDGRGFSQAQLLRRRYGFDGEIRAVGQVLRDEIDKMARCGINAFHMAIARDGEIDIILTEVSRYTQVYQPGALAGPTIHRLRHSRQPVTAAAQ